jgi:cold-inducible RNA-binding protein
MKIYVGNIPFSATDQQLRELFGQHGQVASAQVMIDRDTGRSRGFGFIEMPSDAEARKAIEALNGYSMDGRPLVVNEARPREERGPRGGGRGRG